MNILITGGTGFLGAVLCRRLQNDGHTVTVLSRDRDRASHYFLGTVDCIESLDELERDNAPQAIVNLAGQNLGSGRWTPELKEQFITSRVGMTTRLVDYIAQAERKPGVLISGSAIGYYGARGDQTLDEADEPGAEFQADLCKAWEAEARKAEPYGVRVCLSRTGAVLGLGGGPLSSMLPIFRLGLGGQLGNGRQWLSWIHLEDVIGIVRFLLAHDSLSGAFNVTAPDPVTNKAFTKALGGALKRPTLLRVPSLALKLRFGEMSRLFLTGQKVLPVKLLEAGYGFEYPDVRAALESVVAQQ